MAGVFLALVVIGIAAVAWSRVGLLDLPRIPAYVTADRAGFGQPLVELHRLDHYIRGAPDPQRLLSSYLPLNTPPGWDARSGVDWITPGKLPVNRKGNPEIGLEVLRAAAHSDPDNLVIANVYRMEVFKLRRAFLHEARRRGELTPAFPPHLDRQPIAFFEELVRTHASRETRLSLALAWVDEMLLFPALEIKAPASVQSVDILTEILQGDDAWYVPALFARGLNHLHRPARLVWPESARTGPDAAVKDIALCVAVGRKLNVGSPRLHATLAMTLGDAYVKAGRYAVARSWWQIAQNLCHDDDTQQAVRRRYGWHDHEMLDRLEAELDRARAQLDHPMTDLALMWK